MEDMYQKVKAYYDQGLWDKTRLGNMVVRDVITEEEYIAIVGSGIEGGGVKGDLMIGATAAEDGAAGLVPPPEKGDRDRYLRSDGIWTSADGGDADTVGGKTADELLDYRNATNTPTIPTSLPANGGNADTIDGFHAAQTPNAKNTCIVRDGNGYAQLNYIASNTANNEDPGISQFITTNGNDNYFRKASLSHVKNSMGIGAINNGRVFSTRIRPYVAYPGYVDFLQITSQRIPDYKYTADSYPRIRAYFFILYDYTVLVSCSLWLNGSARSFKYNAESNDRTFNMYAANTGGDRYDLYLSTAGGHPNTARTIDIFGIVQIGAYEIKNTTVTSLPTGNFSLTDSSSLL